MGPSKRDVLRSLHHVVVHAERALAADEHGTWETFRTFITALKEASQTIEAATPESFVGTPSERAELEALVVEIRQALVQLGLKLEGLLGLHPAPRPPSASRARSPRSL